MIRRLSRYLGPEHAHLLRSQLRWVIAATFLQGITLAFTIPILRALLIGAHAELVWWVGGFALSAVVAWLVDYRATVKGFDVGSTTLDQLRYRLGDHVATLPLGWFTPGHTSTLGVTLSKGVMDILALPVRQFSALLRSVLVPLVLIVTLLVVDWRIGLVALAAVPSVLLVFWWAGRLGRRADAAVNEATAAASDQMVEFAQSQPVLRTFGRQGPAAEQFDRSLQEQARTERRQLWLVLPPLIVNGFIARLVLLALLSLVIAVAAGITDPVALATLLATLPVINLIVTPLGDVAANATVIRIRSAQMDAADAVLDTRPLPEPAMSTSPADGTLAFDHVSFAYDDDPVLHDISFTVAPGTTTAIVGPSGGGKSTIIRLAARFFDPQHGQIRLGGVPLPGLGAENRHQAISPVFQDSYLFSGTLADNVRLARSDATDAELADVAARSGLTEVIAVLPEGWDSQVGEGGVRLSGGEKQRVALARAFLKNAPVLLLDEATASLDAENGNLVTAAVHELARDRTVIVIAHQLTTIVEADQILFIEDGRITERGTHDQLLEHDGGYAAHWHALTAATTWRLIAQ
ncbi:ABC transporter ATP-binding protein [Solwaraspora sp. WMMD406]|uniref:ABC transporter ATP-binding protein n=1 Tax=Solwaraspora sp. WMMD406 TaxID=3016095 RepID=UPI0024177A71|nr:ABC transporter ATP-binding protein [Solwaraspora sp. WMMD406]MDG4765271.1 ABC transporter ATP-binding protein [Solwaraspora sp. WMMD406]